MVCAAEGGCVTRRATSNSGSRDESRSRRARTAGEGDCGGGGRTSQPVTQMGWSSGRGLGRTEVAGATTTTAGSSPSVKLARRSSSLSGAESVGEMMRKATDAW